MSQPVICAARRTPVGRFMGSLSRVPAPQIGAFVVESLIADFPQIKDHVDHCLMGCVLQAGLGQNPARQVGLKAGLPSTLNAMTLNKVCGSGLQAVMSAATSIKAGESKLAIAGGIENMSAAPHMSNLRPGVKFGPTEFVDHMQHDGLWCAFEDWAMGNAAEHIANKHSISREDQDAFSLRSHQRAAEAFANGFLKDELLPLTGEQVGNRKVPGPEGGIQQDEGVRADSSVESLGKLRPAFVKDGSVTAGNASQISDGAAAVIIASEEKANELGLPILARIVDSHTAGVDPKDIFDAPAVGIKEMLDRNNLTIEDIDLFEINEAFAAQVLANSRQLGINEDKLNITGGGVAVGHPIGASGARVLTTLLHQLARTGGKRGVASLCLGGGNSVNMLVERD